MNMCTLATEQTSDWLMCDAWEGLQPKYQPTVIVLDHIDDEINRVIGGVATPDGALVSTLRPARNTAKSPYSPPAFASESDFRSLGEYKRVRIMLLAGADLIHTMSEPGVWSTNDVSRPSTDTRAYNSPTICVMPLLFRPPPATNAVCHQSDDQSD